MKKHISLDQLRTGMYLIGMDQSWWNTPFVIHHRLIKSEEEILKLRQSGVKQVVIDPSKGLDVEPPSDAYHEAMARFENMDEGNVEMPTGAEHSIADAGSGTIATPAVCGGRSEAPDSSCDSPVHDEQVLHPDPILEQVRDATIQAVGQIFEGIVTGVPIDYPLLQETSESVVQHMTEHATSMSQLVLLQNLRAFDKNLYSHVVDVCALSVVIGLELGWPENQLQELGMGALLHDIGYMRLPANLLRQRQNGVRVDSTLLNRHAELGLSVLQQCPRVSPAVSRMVAEHHERMDGSGYPVGLKGSAISAAGQLIGLIDRFDSLTSHWGSAPQIPSAQVLRDLFAEAKAGRFDELVVERMIRCFGIYPVGSLVELSTNERAVVVMINPDDLLKPIMKVVSDEHGALYPSPILVDLADVHGDPPRSIKVLLDPAHEGMQIAKYLSLVGSPSL